MLELFWLLLPVAACSGWIAGSKNKLKITKGKHPKDSTLNQQYIKGLNLILNEQTDKAVDVFINLFSVDDETVETHLALGSLFRRRGEVERALRIHQNVIARPNLCPQQRLNGMLELGYDYLFAGVLDRAENIFNDILKQYPNNTVALGYLLDIYQQQRDWQAAINIALLLNKHSFGNNPNKYTKNIIQYYCELTSSAIEKCDYNNAIAYNRQALKIQDNNIRANLMLAELCLVDNQTDKGLNIYLNIARLHRNYLDIILPLLITAHVKHSDKTDDLLDFIEKLIVSAPQVLIIKDVVNLLVEHKGHEEAFNLIADAAVTTPRLRIMSNLLELIGERGFKSIDYYNKICEGLQKLLSDQKNYNCNNCGFTCRELLWLCPSCKNWDTINNLDFVD